MGGATRIGYSDNCIVLRPVFQLWEWPVLDSDIVRAVKDNCPERVCHLRCSGRGQWVSMWREDGNGKPEEIWP